jgi:NADP-dependent aldehyde dehydrogenase
MAEIDAALKAAEESFDVLRGLQREERARLLDSMADEVMGLGDGLLERAHLETGLPMGRLTMERGRAVNQCRMFADILQDGSWVDARIDQAQPQREPVPKPDIRKMLRPIGPVVVFGASNFPLAISVFGSDTVSAMGAGCPVVVKAHPAHPGTCELLGEAIRRALDKLGLPGGCFSLIHGTGNTVGKALVEHPATQAVAFTGSLKGGRALMDVASKRQNPIPVYAEMGSSNPVFILPGALKDRYEQIAEGFVQSLTLGVGQFCTNPGLVAGLDNSEFGDFRDKVASLAREWSPASMLHSGISQNYSSGLSKIAAVSGVEVLGKSDQAPDPSKTEAICQVFSTTIETFLNEAALSEENFGPSSVLLTGKDAESLEKFAESLEGQLTATIHATDDDLAAHRRLIQILERKVGRLIINGYPTGLEVCSAMHHGGPYPAASHSFFTSVGTDSILRFVRPVSYQGFPQSMLPDELKDENPLSIWRTVDNQLTRDPI